MRYPELLVMRHGETQWNLEGRMQGALDSPLTPLGRSQAEAQNRILREFGAYGWPAYVSSQGRARTTADIALRGVTDHMTFTDELVEIGVGSWAGKLRADLARDLPADAAYEDGPDGAISLYEFAPQGEGFVTLRARAERFLARLAGPTILVTHGITSRMLRAVILDVPNKNLGDLPGGQGVVYHLEGGRQTRLE